MAKRKGRTSSTPSPMVFGKQNYMLLAIGVILVIAGFTLMYMENEVSGIISLYISPIVIMGGYITVVFAIIKRSVSSSTESGT